CHHLPRISAERGKCIPCGCAPPEIFSGVREYSQPSPEIPGLAGSVLIAHPSLLDPNFRRSVVYITADDVQHGTHGIIINRPTDNTVGDLLPGADMGVLAELPVFVGGPVGQDQLVFALFTRHGASQIIECKPHLEIEQAREWAEKSPGAVRAFVGYS